MIDLPPPHVHKMAERIDWSSLPLYRYSDSDFKGAIYQRSIILSPASSMVPVEMAGRPLFVGNSSAHETLESGDSFSNSPH